ncbi:MAG: nitroreductase family protein [Candidatus Saganbacteria bacterium]|nr:nitroreductase family protein [Candidatus Saganbacteria bacterium]
MVESKILEIIRRRHSVRSYLERPIEEEKLLAILEAARLAPSASNSQPWHFYVVRDKDKIDALAGKMPLGSQLIANSFIAQAPVVVVATAGPLSFLTRIASFVVNKKWYYLDLGIALEHMALAACELGLGSCWIGWFDQEKVRRLLALPAGEEVIAFLTLGYPSDPAVPPKQRKELKAVVKYV